VIGGRFTVSGDVVRKECGDEAVPVSDGPRSATAGLCVVLCLETALAHGAKRGLETETSSDFSDAVLVARL
jgi:hypothetical protein